MLNLNKKSLNYIILLLIYFKIDIIKILFIQFNNIKLLINFYLNLYN